MSHQISHVFRLTLIASAIAAIPSLHAQTPDATNATRSQTPIAKTPQSVVVLTRRLLDEQGVTTLPDALRNVGAVRAMDARDILNGGLRIRGFDAGVIVDGVTLPGSFSTPESLAGVARVEVVKGPTGTLYGGSQAAGNNGFMGGTVAVVTAAPEARASREVGARFGTRGDQAYRSTSTNLSAAPSPHVSRPTGVKSTVKPISSHTSAWHFNRASRGDRMQIGSLCCATAIKKVRGAISAVCRVRVPSKQLSGPSRVRAT